MEGDPLIAVESAGEVGEEDEVRLGDAQLEERPLQVQLHRAVLLLVHDVVVARRGERLLNVCAL